VTESVVAALQIGASPEGPAATVTKVLGYEDQIAASGARLVVLPEAVLGGYPKGEDFGTRVGYRLPEGRARFARYFDDAVDLDGPEIQALRELSTRISAHLVLGVIERAGSTLYCTALFLDPDNGLIAKHRKLMPTGSERLIWGQGDGSTLPVVDTAAGKAGAVICWENHMPLLRTAMYAKGVQIWCAPTVDDRDIWQASMRHIAFEGRCFLVSACQYVPSPQPRNTIRGGSMIVGPLGDVLAEPLIGTEGLLTAAVDTALLARARYDFDVTGHYARPDVFTLSVDESPRSSVTFR
jgi:nitrilase